MAVAASTQDDLSIPESDLDMVYIELYAVRAKWDKLGLRIKIVQSDIDAISVKHRNNPDDCFRELLTTWLRNHPKPTWTTLVSALKSPTVGYGNLAEKVRRKYLSTSTGGKHGGSSVDLEDDEELKMESTCGCGKCSTEEYTECPNPIPLEIHHALVSKHRHLNPYQRRILQTKLRRKSKEIQEKYLRVITAFKNSLSEKVDRGELSLKKLVDYMTIIPAFDPVHKSPPSSLFEEHSAKLRSINNVDEVIEVMQQYSSFFFFQPLEKMIAKYGTDEDKKRLQEYKTELIEYAQRRIDEYPSIVGYQDKRGHVDMIMKLDSRYDNYSWIVLQEFCVELSDLLHIAQATLYLCRIKEGCFKLTFQIPSFVYKAIFPLSAVQEKDLSKLGVLYLSCGEYFFPQQDKLHILIEDAICEGNFQRMKSLLPDEDMMFNLNISNQEGKSLLIVAADGGHELAMLTLLDGGADVHFIHETSGKTALFFAAEKGHHEATAILLAYGADRLQTDKAGDTPFTVASKNGHIRVCEELEADDSSKRPSVRTISAQQLVSETVEGVGDAVLGIFRPVFHRMFSDLIGATKVGDLKAVTDILEQVKEVDVDALVKRRESDKHGWTALMWASDRGFKKIVELLLDKGADPNEAALKNGWSSLMLASRRGYLRIVKTLLDRGANIDQQNDVGITSLAIAIYEGRTLVALLLLHRDADVNLPDENGWTALIRASNEGNLKLVKVISDLGGIVNDQTKEGWSSLMVASHYGHTEVVKELAKRGADLNLSTKDGDTALHLATLRKHVSVVRQFAMLKADLDVSNKEGLTALMVATIKGYNEVVDALLEGGANVHYQHPKTKWTTIFSAAKNGYVDVFQNLLSYGAKTEIEIEDGNFLSVIDVASHLKQIHIVSAMGTSVDYVPVPKKLESEKIDENVKIMDSHLLALESRIMQKIDENVKIMNSLLLALESMIKDALRKYYGRIVETIT